MSDKEEIRVLVCGGREFGQWVEQVLLLRKALQEVVFTMLPAKFPGRDITVWHGDASGADAQTKTWASINGVPCFGCQAPWAKYEKAAGPIRNQWMLDYGRPHLVVAFTGGNGTKDMITRAAKAGLPVLLVGGTVKPRFEKYQLEAA
jgi:hypothetical protein